MSNFNNSNINMQNQFPKMKDITNQNITQGNTIKNEEAYNQEIKLDELKPTKLEELQKIINKEQENIEYDLGIYHFIPKLRELSSANGKVTLSPKENELLKMLSEYKNDLLQRELALKKIWGNDNYFNGRSMDVYIAKLRKYLKEDPNVEIVNIHGNGFRLIVK
jgi:DNA-binding response OmpR family regulator